MAALDNDREGMTAREGGGCGEAEVGHPREDNFTQEGVGKIWLAEEVCEPGSDLSRDM